MNRYTLKDFRLKTDNFKIHENGTWSVPVFEDKPKWNINYSRILSELIFIAGRYCENYASDLFIIWQSLEERLKNPDYKGESLILGFRENGVDKNETIISNYDKNRLCYRKIVSIEIIVTGNRIDMYM